VILHVSVDVKKLCALGKSYPWPRPKRCFSCQSSRIWGHGYVLRYFEGFMQPLWVRRYRCPDCRTVYTLRPDLFPGGFPYSLWTILCSLMTKIFLHSFIPSQLHSLHPPPMVEERVITELATNSEGYTMRELEMGKTLIEDQALPIRFYNYSNIQDHLKKKYHAKASFRRS
jgi:hypothetical protein